MLKKSTIEIVTLDVSDVVATSGNKEDFPLDPD